MVLGRITGETAFIDLLHTIGTLSVAYYIISSYYNLKSIKKAVDNDKSNYQDIHTNVLGFLGILPWILLSGLLIFGQLARNFNEIVDLFKFFFN